MPSLPRISRLAKDPRFERLPCSHKGTYADDCIVERVQQVGLGRGLGLGSPTAVCHPADEGLLLTVRDALLPRPVLQHRCFIVATCNKDLKRRIRKVSD